MAIEHKPLYWYQESTSTTGTIPAYQQTHIRYIQDSATGPGIYVIDPVTNERRPLVYSPPGQKISPDYYTPPNPWTEPLFPSDMTNEQWYKDAIENIKKNLLPFTKPEEESADPIPKPSHDELEIY